jgi:pheromone shutdown-related protein TraB
MDSLIIVGTSHIAQESIDRVRKAIEESRPSVVAIELDMQRFYALTHKVKRTRLSLASLRKVGVKGFLFAVIGSYVSQKLGRMVGVEPGDEMKAAIAAARNAHAKIALIDQDIDITLARFSRFFTWRERFRLIGDIFRGIFWKKREIERWGLAELDLSKVPPEELVVKLMTHMRHRYPSLYRVLVDERNKVMAAALDHLQKQHPAQTIVAVVGAGHVEGIRAILARTP